MKSKIARKMVLVLGLACSLLAALPVTAQEIVELGEYGKVQVTYMLVSEEMGETNALKIANMGGVVNMNQYPDGQLAIKVEVLEMKNKNKNTLYLGPLGLPTTLHGFTRSGSWKPNLKKKDKVTVKYNYALAYLDESKAVMKASFYVKDQQGNILGNKNGYHARGQSYRLVLPDAAEAETPDASQTTETTADAPAPDRDAVDSEAAAWETASKANTVAAYKGFLNAFPDGQHAAEAKRKLAALQKPPSQNRKSKSQGKASVSDDPKDDIARTLTISEVSRNDDGNNVEVTLRIRGYGQTFPTINVDPSGVVPVHIQGEKVKLTIPKGTGEVKVIAKIEGVTFPTDNNFYTIDVTRKALEASIKIESDNSIRIEVKEGKSPYQLRFLDGKSVSTVYDLENTSVTQALAKEKIDALNLSAGSYQLQVVDALGNTAGKSEEVYTIGSDWISVLKQALLPLLILLALLIAYLVRYRRKKKDDISPEEREKYNRHLTQKEPTEPKGAEGTSQQMPPSTGDIALSQKAAASASGEIRKKITITKREKESAQAPLLTAKKSQRSRPQLQRVGTDECRELLLGQANEYRRISMLDIWQDSIVSDIYIREVVAYRINQFVFEENKAMLEGRGEKIPEIGGWLMGKQHYDERQGKYLVSFERFIQMHRPQGYTTTQLEFGAHAWQALEKAKDTYNDESLEAMGWFHTHPGWGVFLSGEDINTHETIFTEPYAIAMELESVKAPYDVGFFSRRKEKGQLVLNNRAESYHTWEDFKSWLKNG